MADSELQAFGDQMALQGDVMTGDVSPETVPVADVPAQAAPADPVGQVYNDYADGPGPMAWEGMQARAGLPDPQAVFSGYEDASASLRASSRTPWDAQADELAEAVQACIQGGDVSDAQACVAERMGVGPASVARNWAAFVDYDSKARRTDAFSSREFRRRYPYQAKLILERPEMASVVVNNAGLADVLSNAPRFAKGVARMVADKGLSATVGNLMSGTPFKASDIDAFLADHQDFFVPKEAIFGTVEKAVPKQALVDDGLSGNAYRAWRSGRIDSEISDLGRQMERAILSGDRDEQLRLEYERQRLLAERETVMPAGNGYLQTLADEAVASAPGTLEVLGATVAGTAAGAAVGALAGPAGLASGALAGAKAGGAAGGLAATFGASRGQQLGGDLWDFLDAETDDGRRLDPVQSVAAARRSASLGAVVESADTLLTMATLGGSRLLSKAGAEAAAKAIRDAAVAEAVKSPARMVAEGALSEAVEEMSQTAIQEYQLQSAKQAADGHAQTFDWKAFGNDLARTALVSGLAGGVFSTGTALSRMAMDADRLPRMMESIGRLQDRVTAETNAVQDAAMLGATANRMAETPAEARDQVARTVAKDASKADGTPVGVVQVDPSDIQEWFSSRGRDWRAEVSETMGEGAAVRIQQASEEGGTFDMSIVSFAADLAAFRDESTGRTLAQDLAKDASLDGNMTASQVEADHADDEEILGLVRDAANGSLERSPAVDSRLAAYIARMSGDVDAARESAEKVQELAPKVQREMTGRFVKAGMDPEQAARGVAAIVRMASELAVKTGDTLALDVLGSQVEVGTLDDPPAEAVEAVSTAAASAPGDIDQWIQAVQDATAPETDANAVAAQALAEGESRTPATSASDTSPGSAVQPAPEVEPAQPGYAEVRDMMAGRDAQAEPVQGYEMSPEEWAQVPARAVGMEPEERAALADDLKLEANASDSAEPLTAAQRVADVLDAPGIPRTPTLDALTEGRETGPEAPPSEAMYLEGGGDWDEGYGDAVLTALADIDETGEVDSGSVPPKAMSMLRHGGVVSMDGRPTRFGLAVARLASSASTEDAALRLMWDRIVDGLPLASRLAAVASGERPMRGWNDAMRRDAAALADAFGRQAGIEVELDEDGEPSGFSASTPAEVPVQVGEYDLHRHGEGTDLGARSLEALLRISRGEEVGTPTGDAAVDALLRGLFGGYADGLYQTRRGRKVAKTVFSREETGRMAKVLLSEDADRTTVVHELAHVLLEALSRTAARKDATPALVQQYRAIASWLGIPEGGSPTRAQQEEFASQLELYLDEGESEVQGAEGAMEFALEWTKAVRATAHARGLQVSPGIDGWLESLDYSDAAVAQASVQLVTEMLPAALSGRIDAASQDALMERALEGARQATRYARLKADRKAYPARRQALEESARADYARLVDRIDAEIQASMGYRFRRLLATGFLDGVRVGEPGATLSSREFLDATGLKRVPVSMRGLVSEDGESYVDFSARFPELDDVWASNFFPAVMEAPNDSRAAAFARASREYASTPSGKAFRELADALEESRRPAFSAAVANQVFEDLYRLRRSSTARGDIETACASRVAEMTLEGADGRPAHWYSVVRRESYKVLQALKPSKGGAAGMDRELAAVHQQNAAIGYTMGRMVTAERRRMERDRRRLKRMASRESRAAVGRGDADALDALDTLLEAVGLKKAPADPAAAKARRPLRDYLAEAGAQIDLGSLDKALDGRAYGSLKVREQRLVADAADHLSRAADGLKVRIGGLSQTVAQAVGDAVASLPESRARRYANRGDAPWTARAAERIREIVRDRREALSILEEMGGFGRRVFDTFMAAESARTDMQREIDAALGKVFDRARPAMKSLYASMERPGWLKEGTYDDAFRRKNLVAVALNLGNAGNIDRLRTGFGLDDDGMAALREWVDDNITRDEAELVQEVWDLMDSRLYPAVSRTFRDVTGFPMSRVPATPLTLGRGDRAFQARGGYYPIFYDAQFSRGAAASRDESVADNVREWDRACRDGFTKDRAVRTDLGPLSLDLSRMFPAIADQVKYATHERAARDVAKVMDARDFQAAVKERLGASYLRTARDIVSVFAHGPAVDRHLWSPLMDLVSRRLPVWALGFRAAPVLGDFARPGTAVLSGDADAAATAAAMTSFRRTMEWVGAASGVYRTYTDSMRGRFESSERARTSMSSPLSGGWDAFQAWVQRVAFLGMDLGNRINLGAIWAGAYVKGGGRLYDAEISPEAAKAADRALERYAVNNVDWAKAPVQNSERWRVLTIFAGEAVKLLSVAGYAVGDHDGRTTARKAAALAAALVWYPLAGAFLMGRGPRRDEDGAWWAARTGLAALAGIDPIVLGNAEKAAEAWAEGRPATRAEIPALAAAARSVDAARRAMDGSRSGATRAMDALDAVAPYAGLPGAEVRQALAPLLDADGQDPVEDPADLLEALLYGRRSTRGSNPVNLAGGSQKAATGAKRR